LFRLDADGDQVRQHPCPAGAADAVLLADAEAGAFEQCPHLRGRRVVYRVESIGGQPMQGERLPPTQGRHRQQTASSQHPAELAQRGGLVEEVEQRAVLER
jgi:hypothetical protein